MRQRRVLGSSVVLVLTAVWLSCGSYEEMGAAESQEAAGADSAASSSELGRAELALTQNVCGRTCPSGSHVIFYSCDLNCPNFTECNVRGPNRVTCETNHPGRFASCESCPSDHRTEFINFRDFACGNVAPAGSERLCVDRDAPSSNVPDREFVCGLACPTQMRVSSTSCDWSCGSCATSVPNSATCVRDVRPPGGGGGGCSDGLTRCNGRDSERCVDGRWVKQETCTVCVDAGECVDCQAPQKRCSGDRAQSCSAAGRWVTTETCDIACIAGNCASCEPGAETCSGRSPRICSSRG